jgi:hypothetical protein
MLITAASLPALAAGSSILGGPSNAFGAPSKKKSSSYGPAGPSPITSGLAVREPLRPLAEQVLQRARHSFAVAAATPQGKFAAGGMAAIAAKFMKAQTSGRITRASSRAEARLTSGEGQWRAAFGPYSQLSRAEFKGTMSPGQKYDFTSIKRKFDKPKIKREKPKTHYPEDYAAKPRYSKLEFHLNSVRCIEDTNEFDSDEIRMGGHLLRPDGSVTKIPAFKIQAADDFDPGEAVIYDSSACIGVSKEQRELLERFNGCNGKMSDPWAGRLLASASLALPSPSGDGPHKLATDGKRYSAPSRSFGLVLLMFEKDGGGMNEFLTELYGRIKEDLAQAIAELGEATGDLLAEYIGENMGNIVNEIVVAVLTALVSWIVSLFDTADDLLRSDGWVVNLPGTTREAIDAYAANGVDTPSGSRGSAIEELDFHGDGGKYRARLHWRALA